MGRPGGDGGRRCGMLHRWAGKEAGICVCMVLAVAVWRFDARTDCGCNVDAMPSFLFFMRVPAASSI